jgi:hypothetical protein
MLTTIISGGQTGVDRAALDLALEMSLPIEITEADLAAAG